MPLIIIMLIDGRLFAAKEKEYKSYLLIVNDLHHHHSLRNTTNKCSHCRDIPRQVHSVSFYSCSWDYQDHVSVVSWLP